jgi:methylated-DNA-protein-cysteine methyltransferase-like protein
VKKKKKSPSLARSAGEGRGGGAAKRSKHVVKTSVSDTDLPARILAAVRRIPRGKVCTYGDVADVAGLPRRARLVGTVLRQTPASRDLPWFRVINAGGRISFPAGSDAYLRQRRKLEAEGVVFIGGRIDLKRHGWPPREDRLDELLWRMDR